MTQRGKNNTVVITVAEWEEYQALKAAAERCTDLDPETIEVVSSYLRTDRSLRLKSAQAIESVLREAYETLRKRKK